MATQLSVAVRNARINAIQSTAGATAKLLLYSGSAPANCAAAATGTLLATITLPATWMAAAASGAAALSGSWSGVGSAAGTVGYFRIMDNALANCHIQGTVTQTGGGGDMTLDNPVIASAQVVQVNTFTLTDANA